MIRLPKYILRIFPRAWQLEWQRSWLNETFATEIAQARNAGDRKKVESLSRDHQFELDMHREEEDAFITGRLTTDARRLIVPAPPIHLEDGTESDNWYRGNYTGRWNLTVLGIARLREEIRREVRARQELRAHWVLWLSAIVGIIGAATGLLAVWSKLA
jgi:hypothetical protein